MKHVLHQTSQSFYKVGPASISKHMDMQIAW